MKTSNLTSLPPTTTFNQSPKGKATKEAPFAMLDEIKSYNNEYKVDSTPKLYNSTPSNTISQKDNSADRLAIELRANDNTKETYNNDRTPQEIQGLKKISGNIYKNDSNTFGLYMNGKMLFRGFNI